MRSCLSCLQTQVICHFYLPRFTESACSRSSFTWTAGGQVTLEQLWLKLFLNVLPAQPERN